ncbi:MAG: efflux RND transporter permease subunit, partial [Cytophagales bacterium]|nr:efflux RND transporter permease subunit [Cytophagales bacterium]
FAFMQLFGFSINLLTLFALVLAIGIVVDDAIVVVEAVHTKMTEEHLPPREATFAAMREISSAIIAITLVMSAVFIPTAFLSGPVGIFYRQFSLTLACAIVISGLNALTLTPALCALLLKHSHHEQKKGVLGKFFRKFNRTYVATVAILAAFCVGMWGVNSILPTGFIPTEDQGMVYINVTTPVGATVERTEEVLDEIQQATKGMKNVESVSTLAGYSLLTESAGASFGMGMINLKPWKERDQSVDDFIAVLNEKTKNIQDAQIQFFAPPTVPGFGNASGFELRLLNRTTGESLTETADVTNRFLEKLAKTPGIGSAFTTFDASYPQYMIHVDQGMAAKKGVTIDEAMNTLQVFMGSFYATNFIRFGQMYRVMVQAAPNYRAKPEDLLRLHVKNASGEMVPFATFVRLERVYGPEQITRYNMYTSAMVNGDAAPGYSSGDAIATVERVAREELPRGYGIEWSGVTREEILSGNQAIYIFIICLVFVYLLLAAQYESFLLPLPVILSLPVGIFGSFLFLKITGLQNNIYAQVALVMLIGLLGKNAILIVEFAELKRREGLSILEAAVVGAAARFRPILMTSFAFIAGLIPLCIASGAGALGNRSIGTAAAGGMFVGTVFGIFVIPGLYVIFAKLAQSFSRPERAESGIHTPAE